jgi:hypothetical protein
MVFPHSSCPPKEQGVVTTYYSKQSVERMLSRDNDKLRKAGCDLAEAACVVIRDYDGTHRLSLAVAEWFRAVADEGLRGLGGREDA